MEPAKKEPQELKTEKSIITSVEFVKVSRLSQADKQLDEISEGKLEIIIILEGQTQIYFLKVGDFSYSIYKQLPIYVTQYTDYRSYIFPIIEGFYVILIENKFAQNFDILDAILSEISTLVFQNEDGTQKNQQQQSPSQEQDKQTIQKQVESSKDKQEEQKEEEKKPEPENQKEQELNTVGKLIFKTGKLVSMGIVQGATIISKGIQHTGDFIDGRIKETKEVQIKPETFQKAEKIKGSTEKVMKISSTTAGGLLNMNIKLAQMAGKQLSSKVNKQEEKMDLNKNNKYEYIKEVGRQTLDTTLEIIAALDEAATFIGRQLGQSTRQVVKKKYGEQAAQLADIGIDTAGNAGKTYKDVKSMGVKKMAKVCAKETAKETAKNI